jgi:di/tricarboxylate transporter
MFIPGLVPIALGINLFAWGLMEFNIFKEKEQKFHLISGVLLILTSILNLYVRIEQIQIMR